MKIQTKNKEFKTGKALTIAFAHYFHDIYTSFLPSLLPRIIKKFDLTLSQAGIFTLILNLTSIVSPLIGLLADRLKMRYIVIFAPAVAATAMGLIGIAPSVGMIIIILIITGINSAAFHVPTPVMMKKVSGKRVGMGMSFYMLGGELARTTGPLIINAVLHYYFLEGTAYLIPFGIVSSIILFFVLKDVKVSEDIKAIERPKSIWKSIRPLLPLFLIIIGYTFCRSIMRAALRDFLPTYLQFEEKYSEDFANKALAMVNLAGLIGTLFTGSLSDKIGRKTILLVIAVISPAMMVFFVFNETKALVFPLLFMTGIFHLATGPVLLAIIQDIKTERPAFITSIYMTISFLVAALTSFLVGFLSDIYGLHNAFLISAGVALLSIPFILILKTGK